MAIGSALTKAYVIAVTAISLMCLVYVYASPPQSLTTDRDGVQHFTPPVAHPETGKAVPLGDLIRHYRGD